MKKEIAPILEELYEVSPELKKEEARLISVIEMFLKTKVSITPRSEFKIQLKKELSSQLFMPSSSFSDKWKFLKVVISVFASWVLAYSLFSFFFFHITPTSHPASELVQSQPDTLQENVSSSDAQESSKNINSWSTSESSPVSAAFSWEKIEQKWEKQSSWHPQASPLQKPVKETETVTPPTSPSFPHEDSVSLHEGKKEIWNSENSSLGDDSSFWWNPSVGDAAPSNMMLKWTSAFAPDMMVMSDSFAPVVDTNTSFKIVWKRTTSQEKEFYSLETPRISLPKWYDSYTETIWDSVSLSYKNTDSDAPSVTIQWQDIPSSSEIKSKVSLFLSSLGFSPSVEVSSSAISTPLSNVFDQHVSFSFPYVFHGKQIFDENGGALSLQMDYNIATKNFQYVGPLYDFSSSSVTLPVSSLLSQKDTSSQAIQLLQGENVYIKMNIQGIQQLVPWHMYTIAETSWNYRRGEKFIYPDFWDGESPIQIQE